MAEETSKDTTFSAEYVKELRTENASWRTKLRDSEALVTQLEATASKATMASTVANEFASRGIKADPSWVKVGEGQDVKGAVDTFVEQYPQFSSTPDTIPPVEKPVIPKTPKAPGKTNNPAPGDRGVSEVKEDPKARSEIREHYRRMLNGNNKINN